MTIQSLNSSLQKGDDSVNNEITEIMELTKETIKSRMDSFVIDKNTGQYNDTFLKEYLTNYLDSYSSKHSKPNLYLFVIYIDNLEKINVRHSSKAGDETIKNLGYVLGQVRSENEAVFKGKGPGYVILVHDYHETKIKTRADTFQNAIRNAETFVEPITASVAAIHISETDSSKPNSKRIEDILDKAIERINLARELPDNTFIDKSTKIARDNLGKILLVDNNPLTTSVAKDFFERNKFQITIAKDGIEALELTKKEMFDTIIADRFSLKMDAITLKQYINDSSPNMNTNFILIVHNKTLSIVEKANHVGIDYIVTQPVIYDEILGFISRDSKRRTKLSHEL